MDDYSLEWDMDYDFIEELDEDLCDILESFNEYDEYVE